jgi:hypothetical protein
MAGHPTIRAKGLDHENKTRIERTRNIHRGFGMMVRLARESLAFLAVSSFVWMVCTMASHVG